jgi:serine kinase of HPr protein (carbohydrate metabolism regulator)
MLPASETIHASAVLTGERAVLIRGPSGSGKSTLALALLNAAKSGLLPYARLVADDRVKVFPAHGRLLVMAPEAILGMIEARGLGIRHVDCEPFAAVRLIVDLAAEDGARMPEASACETEILGVKLSRLPVKKGEAAFPLVMAALTTT